MSDVTTSSVNKTVAKNTFVLMASQLTTWLLTLLLTIFLPRYLGAVGVGKLQFATSIWVMVGIVVAFGTGTLLTKEIARANHRIFELFSAVVVVRVCLFGLAYAATLGLLHLFKYPIDTIYVVAIIGISNLIDQFATACQATLQGLEKMSGYSVGNIVGKIIDTGGGILLLIGGWHIYAIATLFIISTSVRFLIQLLFLRRIQKLHFSFRLGTGLYMLKAGLPYLMSGIFLVCYLQMSILVISLQINEQAIGWYGAADRLFSTFMFMPTVFMAAIFPVFSRMNISDAAALPKLMSKSFNLLLLIGVPIGLGLTIVATPLVTLLFGAEFVKSGPILAILGVVLIFMYQNVLLGQFLISIDKQNDWTWVMAAATVLVLLLDLFLIPWCQKSFGHGGIGGALAYVITEIGMVTAGILLLPKGTLGRMNVWFALRVVIAGLIMVAVVMKLKEQMIAIPVLTGAVVYLGLILAMQVIPKEDLKLLTDAGQRFLSRRGRSQLITEQSI